jgi:L,D-transpeptidase catalytic domain
MRSRLKYLSIALAAGAVGGYSLLHERDRAYLHSEADKLQPAIDDLVDQGKVALKAMSDSAKAASEARLPAPGADDDQSKLPFIVIEPRDFAAPVVRLPQQRVRDIEPPQPPADIHIAKVDDPLLQMDLNPVEARLRAKVPAELIAYFDLYLYVSKATPDKGDWSQKMFVLAKDNQQMGALTLLHHWKVSTGLEAPMPSPSGKMLGTNTPEGIFKLDRYRFHQDYTSNQWQSPMPYAMFFDWQIDGRQSGLALHGTDAEGAKVLGQRASHGCIRLSTDNAKTLFELIQANYRGRVPQFRVDQDSGTMSTKGVLARDGNGNVITAPGYKVLVFIEDFGGPSVDTVAALY